jgi:thiamine biosynthesis lipoprotein
MIFSDERVFMNTIIRIQVVSCKGTVFTREKMASAFDQFEHVVKHFSRFSKDSELSQLNQSSGKAVPVSPELFGLISKALEIAKLTDYAYDPTVIDLLEAYGYDACQDFSRLNDPKLYLEIAKLTAGRPKCSDIELDYKNHTIKLQPGQRLDLGSIGKGYAIDLAYNILDGNGFEGFLINAGGDLRAFGHNNSGLPWKILLYRSQLPNHALDEQMFMGSLPLENRSIAGSGGWARRIGAFHHLLSPKDGLPINSISQTYVLGPSASVSDAWATALFVTGTKALPLIETAGLAGMIIDASGIISQTANFEYYI